MVIVMMMMVVVVVVSRTLLAQCWAERRLGRTPSAREFAVERVSEVVVLEAAMLDVSAAPVAHRLQALHLFGGFGGYGRLQVHLKPNINQLLLFN